MISVIQGILDVLVSSCAWRLMPKEYPPYSTVYYYFSKWGNDGSWKRINDRLMEWVRVSEDRDSSPSIASIDSQTVSTAAMVSDSVGYDAGKKTKGRKRFTMVDTLGLQLMVKVVAADVQERDGAKQLLTEMNQERHRVPRLARI
jgi:transposase